jgi:putative aldouronate transport system permease protein
VTIYPFWYVLVLSFNDGQDALKGGVYFFPRAFTFRNYELLLADKSWGTAIGISVARTVSGTVLGVLFTSLVAYCLSFDHVIGRIWYHRIFIFTMYFSGGMIPFYVLLRSLGLLNNFLVYIIPGMLNIYYMLILINFYRSIPKELYESAWLDGATDLKVFFKVSLPLSKASLATIALFYAVSQWNSWLDAAYYISTKKELRPMAYLMMDIITRSSSLASMDSAVQSGIATTALGAGTTRSLQMASIIIAVTPILMIYPFLQKYFVKGVMVGSIKG